MSAPQARQASPFWWELSLSVAAGAFSWIVYGCTAYPDVTGGDSGELVVVSRLGGVLHPPGYPLYALLGRLFSQLRWGTLAWRFNVFSATCDAAAAGTLCFAVSRWTGRWPAGLCAAALFAFGPGVWLYALQAEVFALNNLFVAALLLLSVLYAERLERRWAYAGAFTIGLGLTNHQTLLFSAIPLAAWVLWAGRRELLRSRPLATLMALGLAGLTPYLYLPVAAAHHAAVTWGEANTWDGFWTHVLRSEYGTFSLAAPGEEHASGAPGTLAAWARHAVGEVGWWGLVLAVAGVSWTVATTKRGLALAALGAAVLSVGALVMLGNLPAENPAHLAVLDRFWQQADVYIAAWGGAGLCAVVDGLGGASVLPVAAAAVAALQLVLHVGSLDRHTNRLLHDFAAEILRAAPPNALLLTRSDPLTNSVQYVQLAEHRRTDVHVIDQTVLTLPWDGAVVHTQYPDVSIPGSRYSAADGYLMRAFLQANRQFPVMVCGDLPPGDTSTMGAYDPLPLGPCEEFLTAGSPVDVEAWIRESEGRLPQLDLKHLPAARSWDEDAVVDEYWMARLARAVQIMRFAARDARDRAHREQALAVLEEIARDDPKPPPLALKAIADVTGQLSRGTATDRQRVVDDWQRYLATNPVDDADLPLIQEQIRRLQK